MFHFHVAITVDVYLVAADPAQNHIEIDAVDPLAPC